MMIWKQEPGKRYIDGGLTLKSRSPSPSLLSGAVEKGVESSASALSPPILPLLLALLLLLLLLLLQFLHLALERSRSLSTKATLFCPNISMEQLDE